jgi:hypothetical protein
MAAPIIDQGGEVAYMATGHQFDLPVHRGRVSDDAHKECVSNLGRFRYQPVFMIAFALMPHSHERFDSWGPLCRTYSLLRLPL